MNKKNVIFLILTGLTSVATAMPVQQQYFCMGKQGGRIGIHVEQGQDRAFYLTPIQIQPPLKQDPIRYKTLKRSSSSGGLLIEAGQLLPTKNGTDALGRLLNYSFFFNKRDNYLELKNTQGRTFICSDDPRDSNIR
ncbi:MAG: hypothetical protein AABY64_11605 [Bdellovibrionota bacterium]